MQSKRYIWVYVFIFILATVACKKKKTLNAAQEMQKFVRSISNYAHSQNPNFIIIPQNGSELAFIDAEPENDLNYDYLNCINGLGIEELFYNGSSSEDSYRLDQLIKIPKDKKIMVADYLSDDADLNTAVAKNSSYGFISYPRQSNNYDYLYIQSPITNENTNDINNLGEAQNYLYLISTSNFSDKYDLINSVKSTNYDLIIIDLFFDDAELSPDDITALKQKANGGKRLVVSYINVGAAEKYRYYWKKGWMVHVPHWLKKRYKGYKDEYWVKFWNKKWQSIIYGNSDSYMQKIITAGFDGAYLDNVEAYYFLYNKN